MFSTFLATLRQLSRPVQVIVGVLVIGLVLGLFLYFMNQVRSCSYARSATEAQKKEDAWKKEREALIVKAEEAEKRADAANSKIAAYETAAAAGKKLDDAAVQKIQTAVEESQREQQVTEQSTDCVTRANRMYDKFVANGIAVDRSALLRQCSAR